MQNFIKGMDISSLIEQEKCGAVYYDKDGNAKDLLDILESYGCNYVRLRIWNDPYDAEGHEYGAGTNDFDVTLALCKRAVSHGMKILLDFHYSDFWCDPGKQNIPKAWKDYSVEQLTEAVYDYTYDTVKKLSENGCKPDMIQIGNEITNGLLWPYGKKPEYDNIARFVSAGIKAVRAIDKTIEIMIHLDAGGNNPMYVDWFENYIKRGEDFDIIGMSYYPFWHGNMAELEFNMRDMARRYGKDIVIAEVSMGYTMDDYAEYEKLPSDKRKGMATSKELVEKIEYPMTKQGQGDFMQAVMDLIKSVPGGRGFFYWEPGWIPVPGCEWANEISLKYTGEKGPGGNEWANQVLFDYDGHVLPALSVIKNFE